MTRLERREQLEFIFRGGAVLRFHTTPPIRPQTDGAHSFGVAWFVYLLTEGSASTNLIWAALAHDLAEQTTGDIPAFTKRQAGVGRTLAALETLELKRAGLSFPLDEAEQYILDLADSLEGMVFCVAERRLGNREAETWYGRWKKWVNKMNVTGVGAELLEIIDTLMTEIVLYER